LGRPRLRVGKTLRHHNRNRCQQDMSYRHYSFSHWHRSKTPVERQDSIVPTARLL
jgi:hypothetical protein